MAKEQRLIDANALRADFLAKRDMSDAAFDNCYPFYQFSLAIENATTVDAVPVVHGRWDDFADKYDKSAKKHDFRCSVCNNRASMFVGGTEDWWDMWKPNYCPNCGAKMDGGNDK